MEEEAIEKLVGYVLQETLEDQPCATCKRRGHDKKLLVCDGCNLAYHTFCLKMKEVPEIYWYCPGCIKNI